MTFALHFFYNPTVPNADLGLLVFPNLLIPVIVISILPEHWFIFLGDWRYFYLATIFWILFGFVVGLMVEGLKKITNNMKLTVNGQNILESIKNILLLLFTVFILFAIYFIYKM
jgi:hypothetical protein